MRWLLSLFGQTSSTRGENSPAVNINNSPNTTIVFGRDDPPPSKTTKPINLPYPTLGTLFKGRDDFLTNLRATLTSGKPAAITAANAAIHGLGGVGKTRAAVEYAWAHRHDYSAALFAVADSSDALTRNLADLTGALGLEGFDDKTDDIRLHAVLDWLHRNPGWLLILDNIDSDTALAAVTAMLGRLTGGHVLLTSRLTNLPYAFQALELDVLTVDAAAAFLLENTEGRRRPAADDATQARDLAQELGQLALALTHAAAYIRRHRETFAGYRARLASSFDAVIAYANPAETHYPRAIPAAWALSVEKLSDAGRTLLEHLAFLSPDPVPETLLDVPVPGAPAADVRDALADLAAFSLVTRQADRPFFTVHRLVQDVTRRALPPDTSRSRLIQALGWVNAAFTGHPQDVRTWPRLLPLAEHATAVAERGQEAGIDKPTGRLMADLGSLFDERAQYGRAEKMKRAALAIAERSRSPDDPELATYLSNLANLLRATNRLSEAEPLFRRALSIFEASLGPDHPDVATALNNLAALLDATNRLSEAEPLYRRALSIDEASLGPDHPTVAIRLNNLAELLRATNRLSEAEPLFRRALSTDEANLGPDHPTVAIRLNNLAVLLRATNRLSEAEPLFRRALSIDEASLGPDHPAVARNLNNLAELLRATNRLSEAEPLYRRALSIDEASFGPDHPNVARDLNNLAVCIEMLRGPTEAEPLYRRALSIDEASLGPDHPDVAINLNNLAGLLRATNRLTEAEPLSRRMLLIFLKFQHATGHAHPHRDKALDNHAALLQALGRTQAEIEAEIQALHREAGLA